MKILSITSRIMLVKVVTTSLPIYKKQNALVSVIVCNKFDRIN